MKISVEELREALLVQVLKREVIEGDKATEARKKLARASNKMLRARKDEIEESSKSGPEKTTASIGATFR